MESKKVKNENTVRWHKKIVREELTNQFSFHTIDKKQVLHWPDLPMQKAKSKKKQQSKWTIYLFESNYFHPDPFIKTRDSN